MKYISDLVNWSVESWGKGRLERGSRENERREIKESRYSQLKGRREVGAHQERKERQDCHLLFNIKWEK